MDTFTCQKGQGKMSSHTLFKERIYAVSVGDLCWAINHSPSFGSGNCSFCTILIVPETQQYFTIRSVRYEKFKDKTLMGEG